jgi:hypothetical protein
MIEALGKFSEMRLLVDIFVKKAGKGFFQLGRTAGFQPAPTLMTPVFAAAIAAGFNEGEKFLIAHRLAGNAERFDRDQVGPLLVVEDEGKCLGCADHSPTNALATGDMAFHRNRRRHSVEGHQPTLPQSMFGTLTVACAARGPTD